MDDKISIGDTVEVEDDIHGGRYILVMRETNLTLEDFKQDYQHLIISCGNDRFQLIKRTEHLVKDFYQHIKSDIQEYLKRVNIMDYEIVGISPKVKGVIHNIKSISDEEASNWVIANLDLSSQWLIRMKGEIRGRLLKIEQYRMDGLTGRITKNKHYIKRAGWFLDKKEAIEDYELNKQKAMVRLELIEQEIIKLKKKHKFNIGYHMNGDTHGIYEDWQYISVDEGNYTYYKIIE